MDMHEHPQAKHEEPVRSIEQSVDVERRQFALCDGAAPFGDWQLPDRSRQTVMAVNSSGVMVSSTVVMHAAAVRLEFWGVEPSAAAAAPIGQVAVSLPSGTLTAWAVPHGPAGPALDLDGPGEYILRVFREGGGDEARARAQREPEDLTGLEAYRVQAWRSPCS
ncbi:hypothetical protein ACFCWG_30270 [Streptomyces sp. NPDC056390]|uniref:hypothetical protein n=1 Tax=Streptomyces sp. NPDC056390 TaxID=3345806 RepID=UPI0035D7C7FE